MTRNEKACLGVLVVIAAGFALVGAKAAPGGSIKYPKYQGAPAWPPFTPPPGVPDPSIHHIGPYGLVYTPHRYPSACGNDISALIHHGYSTMMLPQDGEMTWLSGPPSEEDL